MNSGIRAASRPQSLLITDNYPPKGGGVSRYFGGLALSYGSAMQVCTPMIEPSDEPSVDSKLPVANHRIGQVNQAFAATRFARRAGNRAVLLGQPHLGLFSSLLPRTNPLGLFVFGGEWQEFHRLHRLLYAIEARCDLIVACSAATASDWLDTRLADRVTILRPGLDDEWIERGASAAARRSKLSRDRPFRLLTVARLVPRKGISEIARVVAGLQQEGLDVELRVVGGGPRLPELRDAYSANLKIQFFGPLSDEELHRSYEWADAFALCPHTVAGGEGYEGFGIVYLEAAAYGLPILATISGGVAEALTPSGALTSRPLDWDSVTEHLRQFIRMPLAAFSEMGKVNLSWARHNAWARRSDELAQAIQERTADARR